VNLIIVVEGISAAGKTTWCRKHASDRLVPETFPDDRHLQPTVGRETARYWTNWNAKRWDDAIALEQAHGQAVCDTDPLKLHFLWSLWQIGEAPRSQWQLQLAETEQAIAERRLGFADLYLVKLIDPDVARQRRDNDTLRPRERFDLHVRLQPSLVRWYQTLEAALGGRVQWSLPEVPTYHDRCAQNPFRFDVQKFREFTAALVV
jgi:folate-binding Fe-S cluster repair protein YgfZ